MDRGGRGGVYNYKVKELRHVAALVVIGGVRG